MVKPVLVEATKYVWSVETRHDAHMGVDTGWCEIECRKAVRVQGSHREIEHGSHIAHLWDYQIEDGGYVRVRRGYLDAQRRRVITKDMVFFRTLRLDCGGLTIIAVPFTVVDAADYDRIGEILRMRRAVGQMMQFLVDKYPVATDDQILDCPDSESSKVPVGWDSVETDHD